MKDQPWSVDVRLALGNAGEDTCPWHIVSPLMLVLITQTLASTVTDAGKHQPPGAAKVSHVGVSVRNLPV